MTTTPYPRLSAIEQAVAERMERDGSFHARVVLHPEGYRLATVKVCLSVVQLRVSEEQAEGIHPCGCSGDPDHNWLDCER